MSRTFGMAIAVLSFSSLGLMAQGPKPTDPQIAHIAYTAGNIDITGAAAGSGPYRVQWTVTDMSNVSTSPLVIPTAVTSEVMKKVTSWAAIIAVPTAVTGFYGQNVPYPGSGTFWGFVVSTAVMISCSLALYVVFKRRDWL